MDFQVRIGDIVRAAREEMQNPSRNLKELVSLNDEVSRLSRLVPRVGIGGFLQAINGG
ncbi:MAG: hypothetical protein LBM19_03080 [Holosporales bacterium]|nr:hypothetical protein [Holosporales bacterium]